MQWRQIRERHPDRWLLVEALEAHSAGGKRRLEDLAVVEEPGDAREAMAAYLEHHRRAPQRELYLVHTLREELEVDERDWLGLRRAEG